MAIASYSNLQQTVADWLNRADLTQQIPDFIKLAESTLNKTMRSPWMIQSTTISVSSNAQKASVPADMLEPLYLQINNSPSAPLEQVSPQQMITLRRARLRSSGTPVFFSVMGRSFEFAPVPSSTTSIGVTYYQAIPPLVSNSTNWLLTNYPDVYLYTTLLHASPFLKDDARTQLFANMVAQQIAQAVQQNDIVQMDNLKVGGFSLNSPADNPNPATGAIHSPPFNAMKS